MNFQQFLADFFFRKRPFLREFFPCKVALAQFEVITEQWMWFMERRHLGGAHQSFKLSLSQLNNPIKHFAKGPIALAG